MPTNLGLPSAAVDPASFRDPAGFVYRREGELLRQVNTCYASAFDHLHRSGLHSALVERELLVPDDRVDPALACTEGAHAVIRPEPVDFVSYPYEWSFGQLRDAALLTLEIQQIALTYGMRLKDASAYNVQFHRGRPIFIDTLSFEPQGEGDAWPAYRQFCEHFLAPLAVMSYRDIRLGLLSRTHLDGIPVSLAARLLPRRTLLRPELLFHLHLHAHAESYAPRLDRAETSARGIGIRGLAGLLDSLRNAVERLRWEPVGTTWADYDGNDSYAEPDLAAKEFLLGRILDATRPAPKTVWDLGANDGRFSRLAANRPAHTVAFDKDPAAVEKNYRRVRATKEKNLLPLLVDLSNPSPPAGWNLHERMSLVERGPADVTLALALIHHLAIGNNVPFARIATFLARTCQTLIIEFVPPSDTRVEYMLARRRLPKNVYTEDGFFNAFQRCFSIDEACPVGSSGRVLFRMTRRRGTGGKP